MENEGQSVTDSTPVAPQPTAPAPAPAQPETDWKAEAEKWKALSRKNEDQSKANYGELQTLRQQQDTQQQLLRTLAEKAGVQVDAETPEQLKSRLAEVQGQLKQRDVESAVASKAAALGIDPQLLLDSRSFANKLSALDPAAPDFTTQVESLVSDASSDNRFKTRKTPPVQQPSGDFSGQADASMQQWTREKATQMAKDNPEALLKAIDAGLLANLGFAPRKKHQETSLFRKPKK